MKENPNMGGKYSIGVFGEHLIGVDNTTTFWKREDYEVGYFLLLIIIITPASTTATAATAPMIM